MTSFLLIDDDKHEHTLVNAYLLSHFGDDYDLTSAMSLPKAIEALERRRFNVVILDNRFVPYSSYREFLPRLRPLIGNARAYFSSASVEDLPVPFLTDIGLDAYIDKFELRAMIQAGRFS